MYTVTSAQYSYSISEGTNNFLYNRLTWRIDDFDLHNFTDRCQIYKMGYTYRMKP